MSEDSKWDKNNDSSKRSVQFESPRTIVVAQPTKKITPILSNDQELTDEYLNSILPSKGFKIVPPPPNYTPIKREIRVKPQEDENPGLPRVPKEFAKLYTDLRPDEELTKEENLERWLMKLLMQIKDGMPHQRKMAMRHLISHANDFGAELIFSKLLPLLAAISSNEQERHSLVKVVDRLMYRLSTSMSPYVPQLLAFVGKMLIENDPIARAEAREIVSNLSKISGLPTILQALRSGLDSESKETRTVTAQTLATAAYTLGIPSIFPFLRAAVRAKKWQIKHTGIRIIDNIAFLSGNGILPFLNDMVTIVSSVFGDVNTSVNTCAIKCITTMAEQVAPYGGTAFEPVIPTIWDGINTQGTHNLCLKAVGALLLTMEQPVAAKNFKELIHVINREFSSQSVEAKLTGLVVFERALQKEAVDVKQIEELGRTFLSNFWNLRTVLETKIQRHLISITLEIAKRWSIKYIVEYLFKDFKQQPSNFRKLVIEVFLKLIEECGTEPLTDRMVFQINDDLIFAFEDVKDDQRTERLFIKCLTAFVKSLGKRVEPMLNHVSSQILDKLNVPNHHARKLSNELLVIYAEPFSYCQLKHVLLHFYGVIQEFLGEEYPDVLAAVLDATNAIVSVLDVSELKPPPDDVVAKLVPIMKNRHDKVSYSCVTLIKNLSLKTPGIVNKKEWMRICFELLELLKADKKKVRNAAIETFSYIAKSIGPFDVLLALLNNLQVQERQIRLCTTAAIAVLAENCGPYNILPALMNEYRTPDTNVQNGTLKGLQFLFQTIGPECADYCYAVTPLLTHALIERDPVHRQIACLAVRNFTLGCFAAGKQDAIIHLLNFLLPNIFESTLHFIDAVIDAIESMRLTLGPGIIHQYVINGLFHPARKVRSQFWRVYNNLIIYSGDALVPYYPLLQNTPNNSYHRDEFDVFV
ncbi:U2 snRNP component prp10 [Tritrichomonas foetus]|uniref:U2 snRNP component prp10 n=1 Tax=Tritrichomonas foetus TaxID=1144522 RepID=A0A1J4J510_9EUKA|nr:U2 snRNP component prp10 [Tritrichomonas foetus]|eukprot:OHS94394.1 U2 snRNP component prp10 [Tritrichomonas foetus]